MTSTFSNAKEHVIQESHIRNKAHPITELEPTIAKREAGHVKIDKTLIALKEWHGIKGKRCLICNKDAKDVDSHICSKDHMVNLMQTKFKIYQGDQYYRQVGSLFLYYLISMCFMCGSLHENFIKIGSAV